MRAAKRTPSAALERHWNKPSVNCSCTTSLILKRLKRLTRSHKPDTQQHENTEYCWSKFTSVSTARSGLLSGPTIRSSTVTCFFSALRKAEERRVKMGKALAMAQAEANTSERSHTIWRSRSNQAVITLYNLKTRECVTCSGCCSITGLFSVACSATVQFALYSLSYWLSDVKSMQYNVMYSWPFDWTM